MRWGSSRRRAGVKKFVPSLESLLSLGFEGGNLVCPGNFARMCRTHGGVQKACATNSSGSSFAPLYSALRSRDLREVFKTDSLTVVLS